MILILATAKCLYYFHLYCVSVQRRGEIWYYRNAVLQLKTKVQFNISYIYPILPHICGKWFISVNNDQNVEKILLLMVIVVVDSIVIILLMKIFFISTIAYTQDQLNDTKRYFFRIYCSLRQRCFSSTESTLGTGFL